MGYETDAAQSASEANYSREGIPAAPGLRMSLKDRFLPKDPATRKRIGRYVGAFFSVAIAILSLAVLAHTISHLHWGQLQAAIASTSPQQILSACGLAALSYLALTGYDAVALRQLRARVHYGTTALASFTSYAVSFTLGFPLITGGTVRYWIYSQVGLSASKVASLTVIAGVTFWLGMALVIGVTLLLRGETISQIDHFEPHVNILIGLAVVGTLIVYLIWVSMGHRDAVIEGLRLELPGFSLTVMQICLGLIDLCSAAGVLYALLPEPRHLDFLTFAAIYVFGCVLGIASHAPGGIGVFEATMLKFVPAPSQEALLASLLLFRIIYYIVPFVLALALLGAAEGFKHWDTLRDAMLRVREAEHKNGDES
ncbi:MAG TPA: lysylphosphatidylglycerol synthase domain-containing protein [Methylovirgula sp.]